MHKIHTVTVLGGGSFGTVLANIMANNGHIVKLWLRDVNLANLIKEKNINQNYLPDLILNKRLEVSTCLKTCIINSDTIIFSLPSSVLRKILEKVKKFILPYQYLITTIKGIEKDYHLLMSQVLEVFFPEQPIGVISGPNLARELALKKLTGTVIASEHKDLRQRVKILLQCNYLKIYFSQDRYGVELGGALKNIYAIAAGLISAMDLGENTRSMLLTQSLQEMSRLATYFGSSNPFTFLGLAGVGDLIATCMSPLSRNYHVGYSLGKGSNLKEILLDLGETAEGINTLLLVKKKADALGINLPLVSSLYKLIHEDGNLNNVLDSLFLF